MADAPTPAPAAEPAPTADELAAARAVLMRQAAIDNAAVAEKKQPLVDFAATDGFKTVLEGAQELRGTFAEGSPFYAHLNAIVVGMTNLKNDVA